MTAETRSGQAQTQPANRSSRAPRVAATGQNTQHALSLANRGYVLETGRVVMSGTGSELLANEDVRKAYLGL